jgi:3-oxoacyl-[acyl-carrier protein] reductase
LAADGLRVVLAGRRLDALRETARQITDRTGTPVGVLVHDIAEPGAAEQALADVTENHGPPDVLVLNAGGPAPGRIMDVGDKDWRAGADLLLLGPLALARHALPGMAARGFGRVVFVTSTVVRQPQPDLALSVVLRSAVTAAAKLLSREFAASGVTVNCVAPGATDTQRRQEILAARAAATHRTFGDLDSEDRADIPAGRAADPAEIGAAIAFLASESAGYVNGTVLTVDGGRTETI